MTPTNKPQYSDLLTGEVSKVRSHLIDDLDAAYQTTSPAARLDAAILPALREQTVHPRQRRWWRGRLFHPRATAVATACAVILAGTLTYLHGQGPAPVSAQTVLSRAAAAGLAPNQVTHFTYQLTGSNGYTGTSDEWVEADANGAADRIALDNSVVNGGTPVPSLSQRLVQSGDTVQVYDPASNTVTVSPSDQVDQPWESIVVGTRLAQKLSGQTPGTPSSQFLQKGDAGAPGQQTLDGVAVYVVQLSPDGNETLYVDAQSYVPRGADWTESGVSWQARLLRYDTMSPSDVPAGTFSLNAPSSATTMQAQPEKSDYPVDLSSAFAQACKTSAAAFKAALGRSSDQSMLATCRLTNPSISSAELGAALLTSARTQLDAAVTAGQITSSQAADELARMQAKLGAGASAPGSAAHSRPSK